MSKRLGRTMRRWAAISDLLLAGGATRTDCKAHNLAQELAERAKTSRSGNNTAEVQYSSSTLSIQATAVNPWIL